MHTWCLIGTTTTTAKSWKTSGKMQEICRLLQQKCFLWEEVKRVQKKHLDGLSYKLLRKWKKPKCKLYVSGICKWGPNILRRTNQETTKKNSMKSIDQKEEAEEEEMQHSSRRKN